VKKCSKKYNYFTTESKQERLQADTGEEEFWRKKGKRKFVKKNKRMI
jgi:hypothetical protein